MVPIEIQTRSIFEEGWSEINHKLLYKKEYFDIAEEALIERDVPLLYRTNHDEYHIARWC